MGKVTTHKDNDSTTGVRYFFHEVTQFIVRSLSLTTRPNRRSQTKDVQKAVSLREKFQEKRTQRALRKGSAPTPSDHWTTLEKLEQEIFQGQELVDQISQRAGELVANQKRLSRSQKQASVQRMQVLGARKDLVNSLEFLDESIRELATVVDMLNAPRDQPPDPSYVRGVTERLLDDHAEIQRRLAQLRDHDLTMIELDNTLDEQSADFSKRTLALMAALRHSLGHDLALPNAPTSEAEKASSLAPSLLTRFFERRADVSIFQERLDSLELEHAELSQRHEILRDRGEKSDITDQALEDEFLEARKQILEEIDRAELETAELEAECKRKGLDTSYTAKLSDDESAGPPEGDDFVWVNKASHQRDTHIRSWMPPLLDPSEGEDPNDPNLPRPQRTASGWAPPNWRHDSVP